jgi:hypothetical protein
LHLLLSRLCSQMEVPPQSLHWLGNSGTFMMLDRRNADEESMRGIILLKLYSDDGRASTDNSTLWNRFMLDFKKAFDVVEKDRDYFLVCAIEWDPETGVSQLDASKYLREVIAKFDMVGAYPSPLPAPAGMKIYYSNESWDGDEKFRNCISNTADASTMLR